MINVLETTLEILTGAGYDVHKMEINEKTTLVL